MLQALQENSLCRKLSISTCAVASPSCCSHSVLYKSRTSCGISAAASSRSAWSSETRSAISASRSWTSCAAAATTDSRSLADDSDSVTSASRRSTSSSCWTMVSSSLARSFLTVFNSTSKALYSLAVAEVSMRSREVSIWVSSALASVSTTP